MYILLKLTGAPSKFERSILNTIRKILPPPPQKKKGKKKERKKNKAIVSHSTSAYNHVTFVALLSLITLI